MIFLTRYITIIPGTEIRSLYVHYYAAIPTALPKDEEIRKICNNTKPYLYVNPWIITVYGEQIREGEGPLLTLGAIYTIIIA